MSDGTTRPESRTLLSIGASPEGVTRAIGLIIAALLAAHVGVVSIELLTGRDYVLGLIPLFDLDREQNIPTLVSTLVILANVVLCLLHWRLRRPDGRGDRMWLLLAALLTFVAIDEFSSIHEALVIALRRSLQTSGIFYFAWVIPYGIVTAGFGMLFIPFLRRLPPAARRGLILSGTLYVIAAVGFEMAAGPVYESHPGKRAPLWLILTTSEELLEVAAMGLCLRTLVGMLVETYGPLTMAVQAGMPGNGGSLRPHQ